MNTGYTPNGSNYHDHLCSCPGCNYDGPEPTDQEVLEMHTNDQPFCSDDLCPCHDIEDNTETYDQHIGKPLVDGLLTSQEAYRLFWNRQV